MPNPVARKRHLKKVLDRWENEGGATPEKPAGSTQTPSDSQADKGDQPPAKNDPKVKASKKRR